MKQKDAMQELYLGLQLWLKSTRTKNGLIFASLSTLEYLAIYRNVIFHHLGFQIAGGIYFGLAIVLWDRFMGKAKVTVGRISAFSIVFGVIQYFQIFTTATIIIAPSLSSVFTRLVFSVVLHEYITSGVMGTIYQICACTIAACAMTLINAATSCSMQIFEYDGQTISVRHNFFDHVEVRFNNAIILKSKKRILFKRSLKFQVPVIAKPVDGLIEIKKYFFNCKTGIKISISNTVISISYYDFGPGINLLDAIIYSSVFAASLKLLNALAFPHNRNLTLDRKSLSYYILVLSCGLLSMGAGAIAAILFNKANSAHVNKIENLALVQNKLR